MLVTISEVIEATGGKLLRGDAGGCVTGVSTDTRSIRKGDLFFALKAQRDGHEFLRDAVASGAGAVVVSDPEAAAGYGVPVIVVEDTLWALGDLARWYRGRFDIPVIGITGSVGKTTTKEMLASILSRRYAVLRNELNYNNEIGVPLTIFGMDESHEALVLEMAMRGLGEIRRLADIARPNVGVITNIGMSHIERLGSQGAIADAKSELLVGLDPNGTAVLNMEDGYFEVLRERFKGRVVTFGSCKHADVIGARIKCGSDGRYSFVVLAEGEGAIEVKMPILGHHNVFNALAAAAVAFAMGIDLYTIRDGLQSFSSPSMRTEMVKCSGGFTVLNDAYNANPASMSAALKTLRSLRNYTRRIAVLGDMLELGEYARKAHHDVGSSVAEGEIDMLVTVGPLARLYAEGALESGFPREAVESYSDSAEAAGALVGRFGRGDAVLLKGSRGVRMEEILKVLQNG